MEWIQLVVFLVTFVGIFLWNRADSRADMRQYQSLMMSFHQESQANIKAIQDEIKDFHGRLIAIEERNKK